MAVPDDWRDRFLRALNEFGNVSAACQASGITRSGAYAAKTRDEDFAEEWDTVIEGVADRLEEQAYRRAYDGSDSLMRFMLRGLRPQKFSQSVRIEEVHGVVEQVAARDGLSADELLQEVGRIAGGQARKSLPATVGEAVPRAGNDLARSDSSSLTRD